VPFLTRVLSWPQATYEQGSSDARLEQLELRAEASEYYGRYQKHTLAEIQANIQRGLQGKERERSFDIRMIPGSERCYADEPGFLTFKGRASLPEAFKNSYSMIIFEAWGYAGTPGYFLKKPKFLVMGSYEESGTFKLKVHVGDENFRDKKSTQPWTLRVRYLTSIVSEQRMWSACRRALQLPYLSALATGRPERMPRAAFVAGAYETEDACRHLNESQTRAITTYLGSSNPINLIQGPPGTGKTTTIAALLAILKQKESERVLVAAPSNKAVQVLAARFISNNPDCRAIIIGVEDKIPEHLKDFSLYGLKTRLTTCTNLLRNQQVSWMDKARQVAALKPSNKKEIDRLKNTFKQTIERIIKTREKLANVATRWGLAEFSPEDTEALGRRYRRLLAKDWQQDLPGVTETLGRIKSVLDRTVAAVNRIPTGDDLIKVLLGKSQFVFSTLCVTGQRQMLENLGSIDHLIVDEAGQATEAETIIATQHGPGKIVLVGDVKQLPATVISQEAEAAGFGLSMMDRLTQCGWPSVMLDTQYRMHPDICDWPSKAFYEEGLRTPAAVAARTLQAAAHSTILQRPRAFYNTSSQEKSRGTSFQNIGEARTIVKLVQHLLKTDADARQAGAAAGEEAAPLRTIGIITFYASQVELITQCFGGRLPKGVRVSSVDGFQGAECDVIILSCVRNNKKGNIGFLQDPRRLNVAVTRPKYCLIVVGNAATLCKRKSHPQQMIKDMQAHNQFFSVASLLQIIDPKPAQPKRKPKKAKGKQAQSSGGGGGGKAAKPKQQPQRRKQKPKAKPAAAASQSKAKLQQKKKPAQQPRKKTTKATAGGGASARLGQQPRRRQQPKKAAAAKSAKAQPTPK
jgi:hypothetical protein